MSDLLERLAGPANVPFGASTVFTGTALHVYSLRNITIVNNTGGAITVKLGIGGVANANLILPDRELLAGEMAEWDGVLTLSGAETIQAQATATGLTITVSGLDQS